MRPAKKLKFEIPEAMRAAAERQGITLEELRRLAAMSGGLFYGLLRGEPPKKFDSIERLRRAGVEIPPEM
jgi:hypothetical protein